MYVIDEGLGDRAFTSLRATYSETWQLLSVDMEASCCANMWAAKVRRNPDGSYDVSAQSYGVWTPTTRSVNSPRVSLKRITVPKKQPVVFGNMLLAPWFYHMTHTPKQTLILLEPTVPRFGEVQEINVAVVSASPYPEDVPRRDKALRVTGLPYNPITMWYDPCTFVVDAYGTSSDVAVVRTVLTDR